MIKTPHPHVSDCRPTPRQLPQSLSAALLILLLCAASPVASEQPRVMSLQPTLVMTTAGMPYEIVYGLGSDALNDRQLDQVHGKNTDTIKLDPNTNTAVILWDELNTSNSRSTAKFTAGQNNQQSNTVSYSSR